MNDNQRFMTSETHHGPTAAGLRPRPLRVRSGGLADPASYRGRSHSKLGGAAAPRLSDCRTVNGKAHTAVRRGSMPALGGAITNCGATPRSTQFSSAV